mmetsp:Transcript_8959/g.24840  ORF Transcript_8959/g.24840 Transcript_8959/m.24840 type:complete len:111 (-) Transcript_8959:106-438(-)
MDSRSMQPNKHNKNHYAAQCARWTKQPIVFFRCSSNSALRGVWFLTCATPEDHFCLFCCITLSCLVNTGYFIALIDLCVVRLARIAGRRRYMVNGYSLRCCGMKHVAEWR